MIEDLASARKRFIEVTRHGAHIDLAAAALEIARIGDPTLDPTPSLRMLDELAAACRPQIVTADTVEARVVILSRFMFQDCGFRGNESDYYDLRNSFLNEVLHRRTGIPITLSIVLMEVARRVDVPMAGVGFPGHFLVRVPVDGGILILDPFFGGRPLGEVELLERLSAFSEDGQAPTRVPPDLLQPIDPRDILARMLRNLRQIFRQQADHQRGLLTADLALVLDPDSPDDLFNRGELFQRLQFEPAAVADYRKCLDVDPTGSYAEPARRRLARLLRSMPVIH